MHTDDSSVKVMKMVKKKMYEFRGSIEPLSNMRESFVELTHEDKGPGTRVKQVRLLPQVQNLRGDQKTQ